MADLTVQDMLPEESGFDDFEGPIIEAHFEVIKEYAEKSGVQAPSVVCRVNASGFNEPVKLGGFSCGGQVGEKWEIEEGGARIASIKGKNAFHGKSSAGVVIKELYKVAGGGEINKGAEVFVKRGFRMTDAAFWLGIDSHWVKKSMANPVDNTKTVNIQLPTDYVRFVEVKVAPVATAAPKGNTLGEESIDKLVVLAKGKTERQVKMVLAKPEEFKDDPKLKDAVFNKGLLAQLVKEEKIAVDPTTGKYF